ncbi:hypothetical protein OPQ81_002786 [Rhizoctonia solani]|nr:hypothetical protein OPQ81_002786 [Rhizoctonia solani]
MIIEPPSKTWLEKGLQEDVQRLRGGGLGFVCCGGGGGVGAQPPSPLEPQPEVRTARQEQITQNPLANQQVPQLSQSIPPTQAPQVAASENNSNTIKAMGGTLAVPGRSATGRTHSLPAAPPAIASTPQHSEQSRTRHQTLPSKLPATKPGQLSSPSGAAPIPEGSIDYGGGIMRSPAFPPSVHIAGGSRKTAGGPPPVVASFMKD